MSVWSQGRSTKASEAQASAEVGKEAGCQGYKREGCTDIIFFLTCPGPGWVDGLGARAEARGRMRPKLGQEC